MASLTFPKSALRRSITASDLSTENKSFPGSENSTVSRSYGANPFFTRRRSNVPVKFATLPGKDANGSYRASSQRYYPRSTESDDPGHGHSHELSTVTNLATPPGENDRPDSSSHDPNDKLASSAGQENNTITPQENNTNSDICLGYNATDSDDRAPAVIASPSDANLVASRQQEYSNTSSMPTLGMFLPPVRTSSLRAKTTSSESVDPIAATHVPTVGGSFRLRTFSFEDGLEGDKENGPVSLTSPVSSLSEVTLPQHGNRQVLGEIDMAPDERQGGPIFRSTSSSYPSEGGIRSPDLTVSPPLEFGRRIWSSQESYGIGNPYLPSPLSDLDLSVGIGGPGGQLNTGAPFVSNTGAAATVNVHSETQNSLTQVASPFTKEHTAVDEDVPRTTNTDTVRRHIILPDLFESENEFTDDGHLDPNISTRCLPRLSMDPAQAVAALAYEDYEDIELRPSASKKRGSVSSFKQRLAMLAPKWLARRLRAGKRRSRDMVERVGRKRRVKKYERYMARREKELAREMKKKKEQAGGREGPDWKPKRVGSSRSSVGLGRMLSLIKLGGAGGEKKDCVKDGKKEVGVWEL